LVKGTLNCFLCPRNSTRSRSTSFALDALDLLGIELKFMLVKAHTRSLAPTAWPEVALHAAHRFTPCYADLARNIAPQTAQVLGKAASHLFQLAAQTTQLLAKIVHLVLPFVTFVAGAKR
jgi:gamma-glutamyl:cysteine ligase YbdK (ATP-grasp superfamily)